MTKRKLFFGSFIILPGRTPGVAVFFCCTGGGGAFCDKMWVGEESDCFNCSLMSIKMGNNTN